MFWSILVVGSGKQVMIFDAAISTHALKNHYLYKDYPHSAIAISNEQSAMNNQQ